MNFDDYMRKIQYISNILEQNKYAENIINGKEIDVIQDFQYICLNSSSNPKLVNDIIAKLAQNGNSNVVLQNIKNISMSMWKDLFDKNEHIKKIFIENYETIFNNTSILTFREIERFLNDADTCNLFYDRLDIIIKKLCTYDRVALIVFLKDKNGGVNKIKSNLESFFQKGEFDISTTYSKILIELSKIEDISKLEILNACNEKLEEMLNRETAIDNETNKMLNWLYDTFEETKMTPTDRAEIKKNIDNAILQNFDYILDKSNYDKNTIKILKQFDCTKKKFEDNKNHYIDKSNKANNENIIYTMNINEIDNQAYSSVMINKLNNNAKANINAEVEDLKNYNSSKEETISNNQYVHENKLSKDDNEMLNIVPFDEDLEDLQFVEQNDEAVDPLELYSLDDDISNENIIKFEKNNDVNFDNVIEFKNKQSNFNTDNNSNTEHQNVKLHEIKLTNINEQDSDTLDSSIKKLISSNIEETEKIIQRVLKKDNIENQVEEHYNKIVQNINVSNSNGLKSSEQIISNNNVTNDIDKCNISIDETNLINDNKQKQVSESVKYNEKSANQSIANIENENTECTDLIVANDSFIKRIWKKILKFLRIGGSTERIGE